MALLIFNYTNKWSFYIVLSFEYHSDESNEQFIIEQGMFEVMIKKNVSLLILMLLSGTVFSNEYIVLKVNKDNGETQVLEVWAPENIAAGMTSQELSISCRMLIPQTLLDVDKARVNHRKKIEKMFEVYKHKTPRKLQKQFINDAFLSDLAAIPNNKYDLNCVSTDFAIQDILSKKK
jgi:hypothetical protein